MLQLDITNLTVTAGQINQIYTQIRKNINNYFFMTINIPSENSEPTSIYLHNVGSPKQFEEDLAKYSTGKDSCIFIGIAAFEQLITSGYVEDMDIFSEYIKNKLLEHNIFKVLQDIKNNTHGDNFHQNIMTVTYWLKLDLDMSKILNNMKPAPSFENLRLNDVVETYKEKEYTLIQTKLELITQIELVQRKISELKEIHSKLELKYAELDLPDIPNKPNNCIPFK